MNKSSLHLTKDTIASSAMLAAGILIACFGATPSPIDVVTPAKAIVQVTGKPAVSQVAVRAASTTRKG